MRSLSVVLIATALFATSACHKKNSDDDAPAPAAKTETPAADETKSAEPNTPSISSWESLSKSLLDHCLKESDPSEEAKSMCECLSKEEVVILKAKYGEVQKLPTKVQLSKEESQQMASKCGATVEE